MRKRSTFAVRPEEKALIGSMLEFANLTNIESTRQVENLFIQNVPMVGGIFKVLKPEETSAFENDQRELRSWLTRAVTSVRNQNSIVPEVALRLKTVCTQFSFAKGEIRLQFALSGVQACYSYAVALILDQRFKLNTKLAQCSWSKCGKFRLDFSPSGRPRKYCNSHHKWSAEAEEKRKLT